MYVHMKKEGRSFYDRDYFAKFTNGKKRTNHEIEGQGRQATILSYFREGFFSRRVLERLTSVFH